MRFPLLQLYRPTLASDGRHGFVETLVGLTNLWAAVRLHENILTIVYRIGEDVKVSDIIVADSGCYRVMTIMGNPGSPKGNAIIERINKPIFPDGESCEGSGSGSI